jgi:Leucine-rich repeat (LRR) protein
VTCSKCPKAVNQITGLDIAAMHLQGELPSELALLSNLNRIHIQANLLRGSIPEEIWQLTSLEDLTIFDNQFSGQFPKEIRQLSRLTNLVLETLFSGTTPALNELSNLRYLELNNNLIEGNFPSISQLLELGKNHDQINCS